jgi:hypothetical protein
MNFFHLILRNYHLCRTVLLDQGLRRRSVLFMYSYRGTLKVKNVKSRSRKLVPGVIVVIGLALNSAAFAQQAESQAMTTTTTDQETTKLPPQELDSLVAPIALYSDSLLAQTLAASTSLHVSRLCARDGFDVGYRDRPWGCCMGGLGRPLGRLRLEPRRRQHQQQQ